MGLPALKLEESPLVLHGGRALNAVKRGAYARSPCLPHEDPAEWDALRREFEDSFQPASAPERAVVDELVDLERRRRRVQRAEQALVAQAASEAWRRFPEALLRLNAEVNRQRTDTTIILKLVERMANAQDAVGDEAANTRLRCFAPILEGVVGRPVTGDGRSYEDSLAQIGDVFCARDSALQQSQDLLARATTGSQPEIEAARADAILLDDKALKRLRQEQVTIVRSVERQLRVLDQLRKEGSYERVVVAEREIHKTKTGPMNGRRAIVAGAAADEEDAA